MVNFCFSTGDAQGMNMIVKAADQGCRWLVEHTPALRYYVFSGQSSEKRGLSARKPQPGCTAVARV